MNTITQFRPYTNLRNTPQTQTTQPQTPAFKGVIGDKVVKDLAAKKGVTVAAVLAMIVSVFGVSRDKVSDVLESLFGRINKLQNDNEALTQQLKDAQMQAKQKEQEAMAELDKTEREIRENAAQDLQKKDAIIAEKDAKIAELKRYEAMAKLTSVQEEGILLPNEYLQILNEVNTNAPEAEKSVIKFMLTGAGQEEFVKQLDRCIKLGKAYTGGIYKIPEVVEATQTRNSIKFDERRDTVGLTKNIVKKALINQKEGSLTNYDNARKTMISNLVNYVSTIEGRTPYSLEREFVEVFNETGKFLDKVKRNKDILECQGYVFKEKLINPHNNNAYYRFTKDDKIIDVYLEDLGCEDNSHKPLPYARVTKQDGTIEYGINTTEKMWP